MYGYHEKPIVWWLRPSLSNPRSTNDIVWAFYVRTQHCYGSLQIVSLQFLFKILCLVFDVTFLFLFYILLYIYIYIIIQILILGMFSSKKKRRKRMLILAIKESLLFFHTYKNYNLLCCLWHSHQMVFPYPSIIRFFHLYLQSRFTAPLIFSFFFFLANQA